MSEDLYAILGVDKGASASEIKSAYRKVARKYHPDVNKDPGAEDTFKKIQKAYSILSDPQKKQQYDQFGVADDSASGAGGAGFGGFGGFGGGGFEGSFEDIFDNFFGGSGRSSRSSSATPSGEDLRYDMTISLEEVASGVEKEIDVYYLKTDRNSSKRYQECDGFGRITVVQRTMLGSIQQVTTCPHCHGQGCIKRDKQKKTIKVNIPAGVETGTKLRVKGEGNQGVFGGPSGDLYVFITVKDHPHFTREENHVVLTLELPFTQLILGCELEVPTVGGKAKLKIHAGTQPETVLRLKSKGLPSLHGYGKGDQYVHLSAKLPKQLSKREKELMEEMNALRGEGDISDRVNEFIVKK